MSIAHIIDGKAVAQTVRAEVAADVALLQARGITPGLAMVLVGDDPASQVYIRGKTRACRDVGIATYDHSLPASTTTAELLALVRALNHDPRVHGVLVQLPLPPGVDQHAVLLALHPGKDVDGLVPQNVGLLCLGRPRFVPCTPLGVMRLLSEAGVVLRGARAVVIGRSLLVGRPLSALLLSADATVTTCHSRTGELRPIVEQADVVVAALGRPGAIRGAWIKQGAAVIDVGVNRLEDGKLVGDVEFAAAAERAGAITPVPGGVGPMTIAMLLKNTVAAAGAALS